MAAINDDSTTPTTNSVRTSTRPRIIPLAHGSVAQEALLVRLEDYAQKAQVLTEWAELKYKKLESTYPKPLTDPAHVARQRSQTSHRSDGRRRNEADTNALHCIALYITVMSFSQKAILCVNTYYKEKEAPGEPPSHTAAVDEALQWFRDSFQRSLEKANIIKTWLPEGHNKQNMFIDRIVYDHALSLLRNAASRELLEDNAHECERDYEIALWMLRAISDDVMQEGNPYVEQDRKTINTFIQTTAARLTKLRKRQEARATKRAATGARNDAISANTSPSKPLVPVT